MPELPSEKIRPALAIKRAVFLQHVIAQRWARVVRASACGAARKHHLPSSARHLLGQHPKRAREDEYR